MFEKKVPKTISCQTLKNWEKPPIQTVQFWPIRMLETGCVRGCFKMAAPRGNMLISVSVVKLLTLSGFVCLMHIVNVSDETENTFTRTRRSTFEWQTSGSEFQRSISVYRYQCNSWPSHVATSWQQASKGTLSSLIKQKLDANTYR